MEIEANLIAWCTTLHEREANLILIYSAAPMSARQLDYPSLRFVWYVTSASLKPEAPLPSMQPSPFLPLRLEIRSRRSRPRRPWNWSASRCLSVCFDPLPALILSPLSLRWQHLFLGSARPEQVSYFRLKLNLCKRCRYWFIALHGKLAEIRFHALSPLPQTARLKRDVVLMPKENWQAIDLSC